MKRFLRLVFLGAVCSAGLVAGLWWWKGATDGAALIPDGMSAGVPAGCHQLVVVRPDGMDAVTAQVWLLQRSSNDRPWRIAAGPLAASVGRNGSGWGRDGSDRPNPGIYPDKKEGDGRSPAGSFAISSAFGTAPQAPGGIRLPWLECTPTLRGVDDAKSRYYNQIVDESAIPDKDWDSAEIMRREDGAYELGLLIDHNADRLPGAGSCIFLHLWKGPGQGTAGCTALAREDVLKILTWLDPALQPRLVLGVDR